MALQIFKNQFPSLPVNHKINNYCIIDVLFLLKYNQLESRMFVYNLRKIIVKNKYRRLGLLFSVSTQIIIICIQTFYWSFNIQTIYIHTMYDIRKFDCIYTYSRIVISQPTPHILPYYIRFSAHTVHTNDFITVASESRIYFEAWIILQFASGVQSLDFCFSFTWYFRFKSSIVIQQLYDVRQLIWKSNFKNRFFEKIQIILKILNYILENFFQLNLLKNFTIL